MAFTLTRFSATQTAIPAEPPPQVQMGHYSGEVVKFVNTGGSTGGTVTAEILTVVEFVTGVGVSSCTVATNVATITTAADASGFVILWGHTR